MTTKEWKSSGRYFKYKEYNIFYKEHSIPKKDVIILLHGFPTASWDWHKMWKLLKNDFHLVCLDFLGFGFSDKPTNIQYSIHLQTDIVLEFIQHLNIERYHIIAHDYGVSVAQELLARQNENHLKNIMSICFLNGGLFAEMHRPLLIQKLMLSPLKRIMPFFIGKKSLDKNFKKIFGSQTQATKNELNEFWNLIIYNNGKKVFPLLITYMLDRKKHRDRWCLPLITPSIPIRLINGNLDPISGKHVCDRYQELYPQANIIHLKNIGHYPNTEAPQEVVHYFLEFYQKNKIT